MHHLIRICYALAIAWTINIVPAAPAFAQAFPSKAVRIVVPYPAGGSTDTLARALALELGTLWKQPVIVDNVSGAGGGIGTEKVASARPDGHTLLLTIGAPIVGNRFLYKKLPYDPDKGLSPITMVARSGLFVTMNPSFPATSLRDLVEAARKDAGKIAYASYGMGTEPHLFFETLAKHEGVSFLHVPYKGIVPEMNAVVAGEVQVSLASPIAAIGMLKAGRLKALAIGGPRRSTEFPDVPTVAEAGYAYAAALAWWGVFAPGGTDAQLVQRISRDVIGIAKRPDFTEKYITGLGLDLVGNTPSEFAAAIRADVDVTTEMVKAAGVRPD